jgi:hypothetical protein
MNRWVTDRPPTIEEVAEYGYAWITQKQKLVFATGYYIRVYWKRIEAWEMPPTAYSEIGEAKETAEMVAALWDRHRANG